MGNTNFLWMTVAGRLTVEISHVESVDNLPLLPDVDFVWTIGSAAMALDACVMMRASRSTRHGYHLKPRPFMYASSASPRISWIGLRSWTDRSFSRSHLSSVRRSVTPGRLRDAV